MVCPVPPVPAKQTVPFSKARRRGTKARRRGRREGGRRKARRRAVRLEKVVTGIEESFALPDVTIEGERVPVDHRELALAKA